MASIKPGALHSGPGGRIRVSVQFPRRRVQVSSGGPTERLRKSVVDRRGGAPLTLARRVPSQWSQHPVSWRVTAGSRRIVLRDRGAGVRRERETQMDWNIIEGKWKELKGHAREAV